MFEKRVFIPCEDHDIPMVITYPEESGKWPCMLLLHGFMAYKEGDGYLFRKTAEVLAKNGIASARIDFCSMGENRYSREHYGIGVCVKETHTAYCALVNDSHIQSDKIGLLGHSMGGKVACLCADLPSKCIVTFNGLVTPDESTPFRMKGLDRDAIEKDGFAIFHTSDGRAELLFPEFLKGESITSDIVYQYENPILICVGAQDPTLPPRVSYDFVKKQHKGKVDLLAIEGANHTFNAKTGDYTKVYELLASVVNWLRTNLEEI